MKTAEWSSWGKRKLKKILKEVEKSAALKRLGGLSRLELENGLQVELSLVGISRMTQVNHAYRGKNQSTDVLSFPSPEIFKRQGHLGELIICLPVMRKQAKELAHTEQTEFQVLLVHGVLHLLGLDHERGPEATLQMARWETRLLAKAGVKVGPRTVSGLIDRQNGERSDPRATAGRKRGKTWLRKMPSKRWTVESP
jgi:probable rRNA maturation factor